MSVYPIMRDPFGRCPLPPKLSLVPVAEKTPVARVRFALSLIGAPILVGLLGTPLLLIPPFAVLFGGVPYLLSAGPAFWIALRHGVTEWFKFALIALILNLIVTPVFALLIELNGDLAMFMVLFGMVFAPVWGAVFGWLYAANATKLEDVR